jgi:hypothetical protein
MSTDDTDTTTIATIIVSQADSDFVRRIAVNISTLRDFEKPGSVPEETLSFKAPSIEAYHQKVRPRDRTNNGQPRIPRM